MGARLSSPCSKPELFAPRISVRQDYSGTLPFSVLPWVRRRQNKRITNYCSYRYGTLRSQKAPAAKMAQQLHLGKRGKESTNFSVSSLSSVLR